MPWLREPGDVGVTRLGTLYDHHIAYRRAGRWRAGLEMSRSAVTPLGAPPDLHVEVEGDVPATPFLMTTSKGLLRWDGAGFTRLVPGPTFGLTVRGDTVYVFQQTGRHGRVLALRDTPSGTEVTPVVWGLSRNVHQIDFVDDELFVTDTLRNRILIYRLNGLAHATDTARSFVVDENARPDTLHINSIYRRDGLLYLMAHNRSVRTGKQSEILVFDSDLRQVDVIGTGGRCCHNVFLDGDDFVLCRSLEQTLAVGGEDVLHCDGFPRGLAVNSRSVLVGVTTVAATAAGRHHGRSSVEFLRRDYQWTGRISLTSGQIRDIRLLGGDLALCNATSDAPTH